MDKMMNLSTKQPRQRIWNKSILIFAVALLFRLINQAYFSNHLFYRHLSLDAHIYVKWAERILAHNDLEFGFVFNPLYPYYIALFKVLFGSFVSVQISQAVLGAASVVCFFHLTRLLFSESVAWIAAAISAFYGPSICLESFFLIETLNLFLISISTLCLVLALQSNQRRLWLLAGICAALASVARPNYLLSLPLTVGIILLPLYRIQSRWTDSRSGLLLFTLGFVTLILLPIARNFTYTERVVPVTSGYGIMLYQGNNPEASGTVSAISEIPGSASPYHSSNAYARYAEAHLGRSLNAEEVSRFFAAKAWTFIVSNPLEWFSLIALKGLLFINGYETNDYPNISYYSQFSPLAGLPLLNFYMVFPLFGLGLLLALWHSKASVRLHVVVLIPLFTTLVTCLAILVTGRYRMAALPSMFPYAAYAVVQIFQVFRKKQWHIIATYAGVLSVLIWLGSYHLYRANPSREDYRMSVYAMRENNPQTARHYLMKALEKDPNYIQALNNLAVLDEVEKNWASALSHWRRVYHLAGLEGSDVHIERAIRKIGEIEKHLKKGIP